MRALEDYGERAERLEQLRNNELPGALLEAEGEGHYMGSGGRLVGAAERRVINEARPDSQRSEGGHAGTLAREEIEAARKRLRNPNLDDRERVEALRALRIAEENLEQARANVLALIPQDDEGSGKFPRYPRTLSSLLADPRELAEFAEKDDGLLAASLVAEAGLTQPELEVLILWSVGYERREMAALRGVGEETIKSQLSGAKRKLKLAAGL